MGHELWESTNKRETRNHQRATKNSEQLAVDTGLDIGHLDLPAGLSAVGGQAGFQ